MSRINLVPPSELHRLHLLAEYRELPRVASYLKKSLSTGDFNYSHIPKKFTLGPGHIKFFYNKLIFLHSRFMKIVEECESRGFKVTFKDLHDWDDWSNISELYWNDWKPSLDDIELSRKRIKERMSEKPQIYA